jgi:hypothetical protein
MVRSQTFDNEFKLSQFMNSQGIPIEDVHIAINSSNDLVVFWDDVDDGADYAGGTPTNPIYRGQRGSAGFSRAVGTAGTTLVAGHGRTAVASENKGALTNRSITGTLTNGYVMPGTVYFHMSVSGQEVVDWEGRLVLKGTRDVVGSINYTTKAFTFTFLPQAPVPSGNVLADYEYTSVPDAYIVPPVARLVNISKKGSAADVIVAIYEDSALSRPPVFVGTIPDDGTGGGSLLLKVVSVIQDPTVAERGNRWIVATGGTGALELVLYWERLG